MCFTWSRKNYWYRAKKRKFINEVLSLISWQTDVSSQLLWQISITWTHLQEKGCVPSVQLINWSNDQSFQDFMAVHKLLFGHFFPLWEDWLSLSTSPNTGTTNLTHRLSACFRMLYLVAQSPSSPLFTRTSITVRKLLVAYSKCDKQNLSPSYWCICIFFMLPICSFVITVYL